MLNGADSLTDTGSDNYASFVSSDVNKSASIYTASNCLFAAFPSSLQSAIGYRDVKYDSVYNSKTEANMKHAWDRLWLLSSYELGSNHSQSWGRHPLEGSVYPKYSSVTTDLYSSDNSRIPYSVSSFTGSSSSDTTSNWLRSSDCNDNNSALHVYYDGRVDYYSAFCDGGVSPCFTLK